MSDPARGRWLVLTLVRVAGSFGAVLGVILLARTGDTPTQILGIAIVLAALWLIATVPRGLARRWRSPE